MSNLYLNKIAMPGRKLCEGGSQLETPPGPTLLACSGVARNIIQHSLFILTAPMTSWPYFRVKLSFALSLLTKRKAKTKGNL